MSEFGFDKDRFLYDIAVFNEKPMEFPDDVSLSIQNMLAEIRSLGYEEFHYLSDIKLRSINDPMIMKILLKYYNDMDLFTRNSLIYKISPGKFPEVFQIAREEFLKLSPVDRMHLNGFQSVMSKAKLTDSYVDEMFDLLKNGDNYAFLSKVRKRLCKRDPDRMLSLIEEYSRSVLILCVIQDCICFEASNDVLYKLEQIVNITDNDIKYIRLRENNQGLSVTTYEYYLELCTLERIRTEAKKALKKVTNKSIKE